MRPDAYNEYLMAPTQMYFDKFKCSLFMLRTLERLELCRVKEPDTVKVRWFFSIGEWYPQD